MPAFPVDLRLNDARVLVVGGERIAVRRVEALLHVGARVTVVTASPLPAIESYASRDRVTLHRRPFAPGDCAGFRVVICTEDCETLGPRVHEDAHAHGALVTVTDVPPLCDFYFGAIAREEPVALAVFTDGQAPGLAGRLRDEMARSLDERNMERTRRFMELRKILRAHDPEAVDRRAEFLKTYSRPEVLDSLRAPGSLDLALARYDDWVCAGQGVLSPTETHHGGKVYLVGAGPGDPDLLTVKATRLIEQADDLLVDALVAPACYRGARGRIIFVGKRSGDARLGQRETESLMVDLARQGRMVVRLKGGDPHVFGRVTEEADALRAEDVAFDVVPGVSSAVAAPAAAGISVTGRDIADRVLIQTAHSRADAAEHPNLGPYEPNQTVVILMGLGRVNALVEEALQLGYPPDLPTAIVSHATLPTQQVLRAPLTELPVRLEGAALPSPGVIVFGQAAAEDLAQKVPRRSRRFPDL